MSKLREQLEMVNRSHGATAIVSGYGNGLGSCSIHRWRTFLKEYTVPELPYPMIALQTAGRAKIRRVDQNDHLSDDYVMPGDLTIIPRGQAVRWFVNGDVDVAALMFDHHATCEHLQNIYYQQRCAQTNSNLVGSVSNSYIYATCRHLIKILSDDGAVAQDYLDTIFRGLEMYVLNYFGMKNNGLLAADDGASRPISYALQRLSLGVRNKIYIEDIARELKVSPSYLARKFKEEVGVSPHDFLLSRRIKKAKKLLAETDVDIAAIADECGFSHQSHLTRYFAKEAGMTPSKYRQYVKRGQ